MKTKKVAVINRTNFKNYGSLLQSYALCEVVKLLGFDCKIIWETGTISKNNDFRIKKLFTIALRLILHPSLIKSTLKITKSSLNEVISQTTIDLFDDFVNNYVDREYVSHSKIKKLAKNDIDYFICGSDQVWCSTTLYVDPLMYLRFAPKEKRIAYAPSLGRDFIPNYNKKIMKKYISQIPNVSVREDKGHELIQEITGLDVPVVLDPTILYGRENWDEIKAKLNVNEKYILVYSLFGLTDKMQENIFNYSEKIGLKIKAIYTQLPSINDVEYPDCGPKEFISYIENAEVIFTDSYHGMLFSIMYNKEFYSFNTSVGGDNQTSRQKTVLDLTGLDDRFINEEFKLSNDKIDYKKVNEILAKKKEFSLNYLKKALDIE